MPDRVALFLGDALGWCWFHVLRFRREVVLQNLRDTFRNELSESEISDLAAKNFRHYGHCIIEMIQSVNWSDADYRKRVAVEGLENAAKFYNQGQGGFFLTCHLGNWEILVGSGAAAGIPADIVVKYARNPSAEKLLKWYRKRHGVGVLLESGTAKDILRSLSKGRFIGFVLDQFMGPPIGLPVRFFGRLAGTTVSLALLNEKKNVPILPAYSYRDKAGRLHTVIEPAIEFPEFSSDRDQRLYEKTQYLNDIIEKKVRMHPEQWLWLHKRWKPYVGQPKWNAKHGTIGGD